MRFLRNYNLGQIAEKNIKIDDENKVKIAIEYCQAVNGKKLAIRKFSKHD
jgi:hypothetical protein